MTYYRDFESCEYSDGPFSASNWICPLLAIGWLEDKFDFPVGEVPGDLLVKLKALNDQFGKALPHYEFRGLHECSICDNTPGLVAGKTRYGRILGGDDVLVPLSDALLEDSSVNLFIPGEHEVFIAPGRIDHHIEVHSYRPPQEFLAAVKHCPSPTTPEYAERLRRLSGGKKAPLYEDA